VVHLLAEKKNKIEIVTGIQQIFTELAIDLKMKPFHATDFGRTILPHYHLVTVFLVSAVIKKYVSPFHPSSLL
jgi:hypothetical protein